MVRSAMHQEKLEKSNWKADPSTWSETIQKGVAAEELQVLPYNVQLDYDYYSYCKKLYTTYITQTIQLIVLS